jgi:hypothetical protein
VYTLDDGTTLESKVQWHLRHNMPLFQTHQFEIAQI